MKAIILAGGIGSRLYPATRVTSKQLLPVYDKPMIFYPLSVLMIAGIKDILIICNPSDIELYQKLLGDGNQIGIKISYAIQSKPRGLADAFIVGEKFIGSSKVALILGDNLFYGSGFGNLIRSAAKFNQGASIFGIEVNNPSDFGVAEVDNHNNIIKLIEKPKKFFSNLAIPGLYFYDNNVTKIAKSLEPSARGEIEITDLNQKYLEKKELKLNRMPRGITWMDTGTPINFYKASEFVKVTEESTGKKIACLEEVALLNSFISAEDFKNLVQELPKSDYRNYLKKLI
tara:strand:+ start:1108 stop:1968 length:861 start_codon:yes stop_codon:yes gene_type:complete